MNTHKTSKVLPYLADWESNKVSNTNTQQENGLVVVDLTPQISARNTPSYTQITPSYTPIYHSIQIPSTNSGISSPPHPANDDEKTDSTELSIHTQNPSPSPDQAEKKTEDHSHPLKSLCKNIRPIRFPFKKIDKNVRKALGCSLILFMLVNLALIIYLKVYYSRTKDIGLTSVAGALSYIAYNLDAHPILDIQVQDDHSNCPQDYYSIVLGTWPGTTAGCLCPGGHLKARACQKSGKNPPDLFCDDVAPRSSIGMVNWGGSKWCVRKAKPGSEYQKAVDCADGFRKCSPGICVLETLNCPVTKVEIQSTGTYKLETGIDRYVVTENVEGKSPVIDLAITPNEVPCFSEDYFASGPVKPYVLINENEKGCSKYGLDQYSFQLDEMKQRALFDQNDFPSKVYNLPNYASVYDRTDSVLSFRKRLNVTENDFCLNIDTEILEKSSKAAKDLNRFMSGTLLAAIIIHAILVFVVGYLACSAKGNASWSRCLKGRNSGMWMFPYLLIGFMELVDFIVMFAATTHIRAKMMGTEGYLMKLVENDCFLDLQAQSAVSDYPIMVDDLVGTLFKYSLTLFSIGTFVVFTICYLACRKL